jgi:tartrate-resistant acid phosphatase type 5
MKAKGLFTGFIFIAVVPFCFFTSCEKLPLIEPAGFETDIDADTIVFAQIGDFGYSGEGELKVSEMVKSWNPDFIVTVGDNNYYEGKLTTTVDNITQYYGDYIYNYDAPPEFQCKGKAFDEKLNRFFPTPGNHDANNQDGLVPYYNFFTLPHNEIYYKFRWGPVTFYSLNTTISDLTEQLSWLQDEVSASTTPFNIVFQHFPPYSTGAHGNHTKTQLNYSSMGIDIVFSGHDHIYERLNKTGEEDVTYIVNGLGGKAFTNCGVVPLYPGVTSKFCYGSNYGAIKVTATYNKLHLAFYSIGSPTVLLDEFEIQL